jgi:predicted restriction endonuclease
VTGNPVPELLRASHIVPWASSIVDRLNPRNGLCLAATFDAAFDRGLIAFDDYFRLLLSPKLKQHRPDPEIAAIFFARAGSKITLPQKNIPDAKLIRWHRENVAKI